MVLEQPRHLIKVIKVQESSWIKNMYTKKILGNSVQNLKLISMMKIWWRMKKTKEIASDPCTPHTDPCALHILKFGDNFFSLVPTTHMLLTSYFFSFQPCAFCVRIFAYLNRVLTQKYSFKNLTVQKLRNMTTTTKRGVFQPPSIIYCEFSLSYDVFSYHE